MSSLKKALKETKEAISWIAAEYHYLQDLQNQIQQISVEEKTTEGAKALRKVKHTLRYLNRSEGKAERHIAALKEAIRNYPELAGLGGKLEIAENQLIKAFSFYKGTFRDSLQKLTVAVREKKILQLFGKQRQENVSVAERKIKSIAQGIEKNIAVLVPWVGGLQSELQELQRQEEELQRQGRRQLLKAPLQAAGAVAAARMAKAAGFPLAFLSSLFGLRERAAAQGHLRIRYVTIRGTVALEIPVRKGMSYSLVARYVGGTEGATAGIQQFNKNKALRAGDYIYIPRKQVRKELQAILDENKFDHFIIDAEEAPSLAALMQTNCDITLYGYSTTLEMLLVINDDINFANPIMRDGDPIIIPQSLLSKDLVVEDDKEAPQQVRKNEVKEPPVKKREALGDDKLAERMGHYQNSFRLPEQRVLASIRPQDKFGVGRIRTSGKRVIYGARHKGLDLPCAVGTTLFPLGVGRATVIQDYTGTSFWRNGKVVEVKLAFGYTVKYLHLSKFRSGLQVGDPVDVDTVIGYSGISGNASANNPHVHIQVKDLQGNIVNPLPFVAVSSADGRRLAAELQASVERNKALYLRLFKVIEQRAL